MSGGRVPLRTLCVREGNGLWFMATDGQMLGLSKIVRTMIDPEQGSTITGLSPGHRYRYRLPGQLRPPPPPVDSMALHRLALSKMLPVKPVPPSLALGGSATCFMFSAEEAAEVAGDPFLAALAVG